MRKSVKSVKKSAKVEKIVKTRGRKPKMEKVEKPAKKAPEMIETLKSNLIIKSTQSLTGKTKMLKGAVQVDDKIIPMSVVLCIVNNTVFYTKSTVVGAIESIEEKNGLTLYTLENGVVVTVVDDSAVVAQVETVKAPAEAEDSDEEDESDEEEEEEDEESDDDDEDSEDEDEDDDEEEDDDDSFNL